MGIIRRIEVANFRCLRAIDQKLGPFQVLVGPNASGKSTFLRVLPFLDHLIRRGCTEAAEQFSDEPEAWRSLHWRHGTAAIRIAVTVELDQPVEIEPIPGETDILSGQPQNGAERAGRYKALRYEVLANDIGCGGPIILQECADLLREPEGTKSLLGDPEGKVPVSEEPASVSGGASDRERLTVLHRGEAGQVDCRQIRDEARGDTASQFFIPHETASVRIAPAWDAIGAPMSELCAAIGSQRWVELDREALRKPSRRHNGAFLGNGGYLPWLLHDLGEKHPERLRRWIEHCRTALPDLDSVESILRQEDNQRYVKLLYESGLSLPSWSLSDGTLRLLALTILAYAPEMTGMFLVEEPETGVHPKALETVMQSLRSVYDGQVLVTTHSPVVLNNVEPEEILCFARDEDGATTITRGDQHPRLRDWRHEIDLGTLLAGGVLE